MTGRHALVFRPRAATGRKHGTLLRSSGMRIPVRGSAHRKHVAPWRRTRGRLRMNNHRANRLALMGVAALFTFAVSAAPLLAAEDTGTRFPPPNTDQSSQKG